jgi:hypothetical protein
MEANEGQGTEAQQGNQEGRGFGSSFEGGLGRV